MQWHCAGERAKLTTHCLLSYQAGLELFPPAKIQEHVSLIYVKTVCTDLLASLKTTAFLCFQIHQRVRIADVCAISVPELVSW